MTYLFLHQYFGQFQVIKFHNLMAKKSRFFVFFLKLKKEEILKRFAL